MYLSETECVSWRVYLEQSTRFHPPSTAAAPNFVSIDKNMNLSFLFSPVPLSWLCIRQKHIISHDLQVLCWWVGLYKHVDSPIDGLFVCVLYPLSVCVSVCLPVGWFWLRHYRETSWYLYYSGKMVQLCQWLMTMKMYTGLYAWCMPF